MSEEAFSKEIEQETGIAFGYQGSDFLGVAIQRARNSGAGQLVEDERTVAVISALNLGTVKAYSDQIVGSRKINGHESLAAFLTTCRSKPAGLPKAVVFHGVEEYARLIMTEIAGTGTPTQQQWGDMGRILSNDLREVGAIFPVLWATCDVIVSEEDKPRLNVNPGSTNIVLGGLFHKLFVGRRRVGEDYITVVQDDPDLALKFVLPRPTASPVSPTGDAAAKRTGLGNRK